VLCEEDTVKVPLLGPEHSQNELPMSKHEVVYRLLRDTVFAHNYGYLWHRHG